MTENENLRTLLADAWAVLSANCDNGQCCGIRGRIDAALAAPTGPERSPLCPGEGTWSVFAEKVVKERDEARAALADAYRRGAEAMRKAAMGAAWHSAAMGVHTKIRDLSIPEDKP
jgi:hypothetical protein